MQNSAAWIVSVFLSLAAHYGLMSAAGQISLAEPQQQRLAAVVLGNANLAPISVSAERTGPETMAETSQAIGAAAGNTTSLNPNNTQSIAPDAAQNALDSGNSGAETAQTPAADMAPSTGTTEALADRSGAEREAEPGGADIRQEAGSKIAAIAASDSAKTAGVPELAASEAQSLATEAPVQAAPDNGAVQLEPAAPATAVNTSSSPSLDPQQETSSAPVASEAPPLQQQSSALGKNQLATLQPESSSSPEAASDAPLQTETAKPSANPEIVALQPEGGALEVVPEATAATPVALSPDAGEKIATVAAGTATRSQGDRIKSFMRDYQGKSCIYATADGIDSARPTFTGLGGHSGAVTDFVTAFKNTVGLEPDVAIRTVMDAQCPAVDFIKAINGDAKQNFKIKLDAEIIKDGYFLTGHLEGLVDGSVHIITVDDAGNVVDISRDFHRRDAGNFFAVEVSLLADGQGRNQLAIAILARKPLEISRSADTQSAAEIFPSIVQQLERQGGAISSAFATFKVE